MIPSFLIPLIGIVAVVIIAFYGFTTRGVVVHAGLLAAPFIIYLINRPEWLVILSFSMYASSLTIPGLPSGIQLVHVVMLFLFALTIAQITIKKTGARPLLPTHWLMFAMLIILVFIIHQRGFGLYFGGGEVVGGASYVRFIAGATLLFSARHYHLSVSQWKKLLYLLIVFNLMPVLSQILFLASGGSFTFHFNFVQPYVFGLMESLGEVQQGTGRIRFHALSGVSISLLGAGLIIMPFRGTRNFRTLLLLGFCLILAAFSGFRTSIVENIGVFSLFATLSVRKSERPNIIAGLTVTTVIIVATGTVLAPYLPMTVQRALSFIPFAEISPMARLEAEASTMWRLDVWKYSLSHWREYALLGRGFTMRLGELWSISDQYNMPHMAYVGHNYHNGPISLLLDLGIPGLVVGCAFLLATLSYSLKKIDPGAPLFIQQFYNFYRAKTIYSVAGFFLIFGDVRSSFVIISINLAIMESLRLTASKCARQAPADNTSGTLPVDISANAPPVSMNRQYS